MDRLHSVFDGMFDGVWMVSPIGRTTYVNAAMAALLGVTRPAMIDRPVRDFVDPDHWAEAEAFLERQRSSTAAGERIELRFARADGREVVGMLAGSPISTSDGTFVGTMLNFSDITGKRAFEARFAQDEKMKAIGEFAGGLAHDFNNLLTAIRGHAELAHAEAPAGSAIAADLDQVIVSVDRASGITRSLLAFTRRQVLEPILLDPSQCVADMLPTLATLLGDEIDVILHVTPKHGWILIDRVQFEQVIVNLVVNARDAMPTGGTLTITIENVDRPRSERPDETDTVEMDVRMTVADTGRGMDEATRARIFDPFFTTKALGKGTGLGLATVFGIVSQSGGGIHVDSKPNEGATIFVDLPCVPAPERSHQARTSLAIPVSGSGVVLLVEDEASIREFARRSLEHVGFTVLVAAGGREALTASAAWPDAIDVMVSDVMMGDFHGPEVAKRLRKLRPDMRVIYMSGYAREIIDGQDPGPFDAFLPKPFSADVLARAVSRAILTGQTGGPAHEPHAVGVGPKRMAGIDARQGAGVPASQEAGVPAKQEVVVPAKRAAGATR